MTALIVIGSILLFFILILSIKLTFIIGYQEEVTLTLRVLFLKLRFLPSKEKKPGPRSMSEKKARKLREKLRKKQLKKDEKKQKKAQEKAAKKEAEKEAPKDKKKKMSLPDILDMIVLVRKVLERFIRLFFGHLRIHVARLKIRVAMGDAATTAIAYGAITQAINVFFPLLEQVKTLSLPKSTDIDVVADFTGEALEADVEFALSIRIWHVFHVLLAALFTAIKHFIKKLIRDEKKKASRGHKGPPSTAKKPTQAPKA